MTEQHQKMRRGNKKSTFKAFGNFFALHMVKKLVTKKSKTQTKSVGGTKSKHDDKDAIEAGFSSNGTDLDVNLPRTNSVSSSKVLKVGNGSESFLSNGVDLSSVKTIPGAFGLVNHGNTCYINSIVQCLSNTDALAEYFVMGQYKADLKNCKKERSKKYGTKGEVTESLAILVRSLWTGTYSQDLTKHLKDTMGKFDSQYKGTTQHDSQEFLLWLFDKLHEDLNQLPSKKFSFSRKQSIRRNSSQKSRKRQSFVHANDSHNHIDLNPSSFIQRVFQGQYQSSLTCPNCKKNSDTRDPFLCVSLPIRQRTTRPIYVNVVFLPSKRKSGILSKGIGKIWKIAVQVHVEGKLYDLRQAVASDCGIHSRLLAFVEIQQDGFHDSYGDDHLLSKIPAISSMSSVASTLYVFEMPHITKLTAGTLPRNFASKYNRHNKGDKEKSNGSSGYSNQDSIVVLCINKLGAKDQGKRLGSPMVFRASRSITSEELQATITTLMGGAAKNGFKHDNPGSLFTIEVVGGLPNKTCILQSQQPLLLPTIEKALENCPAGGPLHIKLMAVWDKGNKSSFLDKVTEEKIEVQESVRLQRLLHEQPITCSLEECFDSYTQVEELGPDDSWLCPHCHKQQQGTVKKLSLYTLPDVLVLHLKRFRVSEGKRTKLCTRVEFPVTGLDISKHIYCDPSKHSSNSTKAGSWRTEGINNHIHGGEEYLYDLYAVCNHFGNLNSGHYTACCSNPLNGKWYQFDDSNTEVIAEQDLSSQSAYILFYQRRSVAAALSCGGMSNNSIMSDHWAFNLPQYKQKVQFISQSRLNHHSVAHGNGSLAVKSVLSNVNKIDAAMSVMQNKGKAADDESDEGGFDAPRRPYVRGLRRQNSAIVGKPESVQKNGELRGRQYRSYRNNRKFRQQTSPV
uniref:Ubiquitin carboxyl-terminal hydrolase n=1 Tax=Phallusia mammillata TaxID=59560 RepID=A0A6F9DX02_9ASCI|nr:ubiquitin carboxyl-terminal hydrolase 31-like [Phallusia mammillata]